MRSRLLLALLCCAFLPALPAAAQWQLPDDNCYAVCTSSTTPCESTWCVNREKEPWEVMSCLRYGVCGPSSLASMPAATATSAPAADLLPSPAAAPATTPELCAKQPECTYDRDCEWACPQGGRCDAGGCLCKDALQ
ncbi:MAG TPA: hypothetical protein VHQ65_08870 [Thermoanaerobaculia bacterium]|nr:hypothetical protein [Thermoanaerobaculia bacterium]